MTTLADVIELVERVASKIVFSGVVQVDLGGGPPYTRAFGLASRRYGIPMTAGTRLAIASGSKPFTALVVMGLVERGLLDLSTTARSALGPDLPLISDDVTVEQLLAHRSGIGDYLLDSARSIDDYATPVPVHQLADTGDYLAALAGHPAEHAAGERFSYNNAGFVILALMAERLTGRTFHDLVRERVLDPAGMTSTDYARSDDLPGDAADNYLPVDGGWRTTVFHLPVRGSGDGGAYSTVDDIYRFWDALFAGRIVRPDTLAEMVRARSASPEHGRRYGLGFWLHANDATVILEGYDAGVSFSSSHDPESRCTITIIGNTSAGAWPIRWDLDALLDAPSAEAIPTTDA